MMRTLRIILFIFPALGSGITLNAQKAVPFTPSRIDSLRKLLPRMNTSQQADVLAIMAKSAANSNKNDSAILYSTQAINRFKEAKNYEGLLRFLLDQGSLICLNGNIEMGLGFVRQAKELNQKKPFKVPTQYILFKKIGDIFLLTRINPDSALFYHQKAVGFVTDSIGKGILSQAIGKDYYEIGLRVKALKMLFDAERILAKTNDKNSLADTYFHIARIYTDDGLYLKAQQFLQKALKLTGETKNITKQADLMNGIIVLLYYRNLYDSVLKTIRLTEIILHKNSLERSLDRKIYLEIYKGECFLKLEKFDSAISVLKNAYELGKHLKRDYTDCSILMDLAEAFLHSGRLREAEKYAMESLKLIIKTKNWTKYPEINGILSTVYSKQNDYEKAYHYRTEQFNSYDSIYKSDSRSKMQSLEKDFELAKKDDELKILEATRELANQRQTYMLVVLILVSLFFMVVGFLLLRARKRNFALVNANTTISQQSKKLILAAEQKATLFANISHELRTPVTLINGTLEQIRNSKDYEKDAKLEIALRNSRKLKGMVEEVFELTKSEQEDKKPVKFAAQELLPILTRIVYSFDTVIEKKQLVLDFNGSSAQGVVVRIEEDKFEKIINNIISNAIKFNIPGGIVKVFCEPHPNKNFISISIQDTGAGIPAADLPYVFDRFFQGKHKATKNSGGLGIGLALVKEYTQLHGGEVSVTSSIGKGSQFRIDLPIVTEAGFHDQIETNPQLYQPTVSFKEFDKRPHILLIEDNLEMQHYISELFKDDADVICKDEGKSALEWLGLNIPDIIITDLMMPIMDGYDLLEHIKGSSKLNHIPTIILSARGTQEDKLYGISLGVDDYLIKPFSHLELKMRVYNLLMNSKIRNKWNNRVDGEEDSLKENIPSERELFLKKVETFVYDHISDQTLSNLRLADHLAISDRTLHRICGQLTGMTPGQLIKEIKLNKAYLMLNKREVVKVSELVMKLGFSDVSYFSRQFYARFGKRPTDMLPNEVYP